MPKRKTKNAHLPKYVTIIHGAYWYRPPKSTGIKPTRIASVPHENEVYKYLEDIKAPDAAPLLTLHDCFERYKREVLPTKAPRTQKDYSRHIAVLDRRFGHMRPDEVRPRDVGQFLDRPKGKIQANRQVAVLSAIYAKMVGRWYIADKNPCRDVERNQQKRRTRYVTDAEYDAMHAVANKRIQLAMDLALLTGQRQGDLIALEWKNVSDEGILFRQGKTGKRLLVAFSDSLREVIARARAMDPVVHIGGHVIRTRRGMPYTSEGFRACWQRAMSKALKLRAISERFTFHDLRAKSVSDSQNIQQAFERAGHTSMAMTRGVYDRGIRKVTPLK